MFLYLSVKMHALFSHTITMVEKLCRSNRGSIFRARLRLRTFLFIGGKK